MRKESWQLSAAGPRVRGKGVPGPMAMQERVGCVTSPFGRVDVLSQSVVVRNFGFPSMWCRWAAAGDLCQVLAVLEVVTEDDTVGCDLILARKRVMGAAASFENG
jgi:hypothetical protein